MEQATQSFEREISHGERFRFGENWREFLPLLNDERIESAERSLIEMLRSSRLDGKSFLDIGSGSGLFSLAARRLGASVVSLDYDPASVWCTQSLKDRFFPGDGEWKVLRGSVLDRHFMETLPKHDVVYSWGVLHHTGQLHEAIDIAVDRVAEGGVLFVALYRKTWLCPFWKGEKRVYCASPPFIQRALRAAYGATVGLAYRIIHPGKSPPRGMDFEKDLHDWLGGYPYESITPRELKTLLLARGFRLQEQRIKREGVALTPGCDEYVFHLA
jgi:2-polyprenyl-6-hydroxyphenyl methylase/3-demethylubiquinone-9 3-methyltransferase